ncbi:MAG: deoxyribonuclease IV [Actinomycetota bacterium]
MPARVCPPVGAHVRVGGGLARGGLAYAARVGAEAVQVFASNPRGWAASPGDPRQDEAFRHGCAERGWPVFVHAPYLVNLGSPDAVTVRRSVAALRHALSRAGALGARGVVVHTGSAVDEAHRPAALRQVRRQLRPLLDRLPEDGPDLLLEPTAGQGRSLCASVPELGEYLDLLDRHPKVGVCLDTCHVFAAGADLTAPGAVGRLLAELEAVAGAGRLRLVHANDAKDGCGSQRDRHENIGAGRIGLAPFRALLRHRALRGVPVVVETPGGAEGHAADVATLRRLRDR